MNDANLIRGDSLEVLPRLAGSGAKAIITDPPYKLTSGGHGSAKDQDSIGSSLARQWGYTNSGKFFEVPEFEDWIPLLPAVAAADHEFYMMVNDKNIQPALNAATAAGYRLHNIIVWDKGIKIANRWYMKQAEFVLYFWYGRARPINDPGTSQIFSYHPGNIGSKVHPSEKPVALMRMLIENATDRGDLVIDPFVGAGATGLAALQAGRAFIGIEKDPKWFALAEQRIRDGRIYRPAGQPGLFT